MIYLLLASTKDPHFTFDVDNKLVKGGQSQMLDKAFYEEEVKRLCLSFE